MDTKQDVGTKKAAIHWGAMVLITLISTVLGGVFSVQVAHIKADAGYVTLVKSMEETQSTLKTLTEKVYFMEGEIAALKDDRKGLQPLQYKPVAMGPKRTEFRPIPKDLDGAFLQVQSK